MSPQPPRGDLSPQISDKLDFMFKEGLCKPRDIDDKIRRQLKVLSTSDAMDALGKLEQALRTSSVRNLSAYLAGVIRRITQLPQGSGPVSGPAHLFPEAQAVLDRLQDIGLVRRGDLDSGALTTLATKPPEVQVLVMETFRDRNLHGIRNMAAFFTSHQTQVEKDLRDGRLRLPRLGGPPPPEPRHPAAASYGSSYPPHASAPPPYRRDASPPYQPPPRGAPPPYPSAYPDRDRDRGSSPYQPQTAPYFPPPYSSSAAPAAALPYPGTAPPPLPRHFGVEQAQWGVRIDEFQNLSQFGRYVHPAAALRLQQLWDVDQNKLVSVLNEASWEALAGLDATGGVNAVDECAEAIKTAPDDLSTINSIFLTIAAKYPKRPDAPTLATLALAAAAAAAPAAAAPPPAYAAAAPPPYGAPPPAAGPPPAYHHPPLYGGPPPSDRYRSSPPPPPQQHVKLPGPASSLPPALQTAIDRILTQWRGLLKLEDFEDRALTMLHRLGERRGMDALDEFGRNDPAHMRNPAAYLIGILRKYDAPIDSFGGDRRGERGGPSSTRGRGRGRGDRREAGPDRSGPGGGRRYEPY